MKEFLSNSWVVNIISGILVFFVTNFFVIFKSKKESRKLIYDANYMVLNHIRGYVVDNGLPSQRIIEAVKNSVAREYGVSCSDLLSDKEICEELIKDIISNIYISNENRKIYISMLQNYLEQNIDNGDSNNEIIDERYSGKTYENIVTVISFIAGLFTIMGTSLSTYIKNIIETDMIYILLSVVIFICIGTIIAIYINKKNKKP